MTAAGDRNLARAVASVVLLTAPPPEPRPGYVICEACGKRTFTSRSAALKVRASLRNRARVYRCEDGGTGWHIAHAEKLGIRRWRYRRDRRDA